MHATEETNGCKCCEVDEPCTQCLQNYDDTVYANQFRQEEPHLFYIYSGPILSIMTSAYYEDMENS